MSFLLKLDMNSPGEEKMEAILELLPNFEQKVKDAEVIFQLDGRRLEEIMRTLPHHQATYDKALQEMKALEEWINLAKEKETAKLWKKYVEGYPKALSTKDITAYVAGEKNMIELNQIAIEITLTKNNIQAIVESIKQLGWMMGHITKMRVAELEQSIF